MGDNYREMMGDNSSDTMGGNSTDPMDISAGEETETEYFHEVASFDNNLGQSFDNLQGDFRQHVLAWDQSMGLQGSQGFQISAFQNDPQVERSNTSDELKTVYVSDVADGSNRPSVLQGQNAHSLIHPAFCSDGSATVFNVFNVPISSVPSTNDNALISQGKLNIMSVSEKPLVNEKSVFSGGTAYTFSGDKIGPIIQAKPTVTGERNVGSADDMNTTDVSDSGNRNKTSPKGKGRKSRVTSSTGSEVMPKQEVQGSGGQRVEPAEPGSGEQTFKPSLLDEILTDKKLALMRSPQVIKFLQSQQELLAKEKALLIRQPMDS